MTPIMTLGWAGASDRVRRGDFMHWVCVLHGALLGGERSSWKTLGNSLFPLECFGGAQGCGVFKINSDKFVLGLFNLSSIPTLG